MRLQLSQQAMRKSYLDWVIPKTPIIYFTFAVPIERCPSGLRSTLGKRVYGNVSGVRIPSSLQNINSNPSRDTGWVFNLVTRAETCFELEVNELKTRGREAPDGLLFYFHTLGMPEQSDGHPG